MIIFGSHYSAYNRENLIVLMYSAQWFLERDLKILLAKGFMWEEKERAIVQKATSFPVQGKGYLVSLWGTDYCHRCVSLVSEFGAEVKAARLVSLNKENIP